MSACQPRLHACTQTGWLGRHILRDIRTYVGLSLYKTWQRMSAVESEKSKEDKRERNMFVEKKVHFIHALSQRNHVSCFDTRYSMAATYVVTMQK